MSQLEETTADELVDAHKPWLYDGHGRYLPDFETYLRAIGGMFLQVDLYVRDRDDGTPGWGVLYDTDNCPAGGLRYLGQCVGEQIPSTMPEADRREQIKQQPNWHRGTPKGIARAAQRALTGSRTVEIIERTMPDGSPDPNGDYFILYTYTDETPSSDRVWEEILTAVPDDMTCTYQVVPGTTWVGSEAVYATWAALEAAFPTWTDAERSHPGSSVWTWTSP